MSEQANAQSEAIASYTNFLIGSYCSLASRVLFLWDYFVTLGDEIHYVWGRRFTAATFLFLLNRYTNLIITILELLEQAPFQTAQRCECCGPFSRVLQTLLIFALLIVAAFATLRVYATWNRNCKLALPILLLALVSPVSNIVIDAGQIPVPAPPPSAGCAVNFRISDSLYSKTLCMKKQASRLNISSALVNLLLRDGTLYFTLLLLINVAQIIIASRIPESNYLSYFVSPFTSMLISRFLLDLRKVARGENPLDPTSCSMFVDNMNFTTIAFEEQGLSAFGASLVAQSLFTDLEQDGTEYPNDHASGSGDEPFVAEESGPATHGV